MCLSSPFLTSGGVTLVVSPPPPIFPAFVLVQIGVILRDSNGIAQVRAITGSKILRVLKANGEQGRHRASREYFLFTSPEANMNTNNPMK